jgi:hypothetical protein
MIKNNITAIVIVLGSLLVIAIGFLFYLFFRTRRLELECELLLRGSEGTNFVEIVNDNIAQVHGLLEEVDALSERYAAVLRRVAGAVQHVGVVRFDAFRDLGGLLSFAVALLDDRGNGLVFSSIYGRSESRTYAKPIIERSSSYELSPEEREAIRLALQSKDMGALPVEAKDRDHEERMANLRLFHDREYLSRPPDARADAESHISSERLDSYERKRARPATGEKAGPEPETREASPAKRRRAGRASHVRATERKKPEQEEPAGGSLEEQVAMLIEPAEDEREKPVERRPVPKDRPPRPPQGQKKTPDDRSVPQRRPAEPRPLGLDTPVERLRNREPE